MPCFYWIEPVKVIGSLKSLINLYYQSYLLMFLFQDCIFMLCLHYTNKQASELGLKNSKVYSMVINERIKIVWVYKIIIQPNMLFKNNLEWWTRLVIIYTQLKTESRIRIRAFYQWFQIVNDIPIMIWSYLYWYQVYNLVIEVCFS